MGLTIPSLCQAIADPSYELCDGLQLTVSRPEVADRSLPKIDPAIRERFAEFLESFDVIERESEAWSSRHQAALASIGHALERANVERQNNVELLVAIPAAGLAARVCQLIDGLVALVNADNPSLSRWSKLPLEASKKRSAT